MIVRLQHLVLFLHLNPVGWSMITMTPPVKKGRNRGEGTDEGNRKKESEPSHTPRRKYKSNYIEMHAGALKHIQNTHKKDTHTHTHTHTNTYMHTHLLCHVLAYFLDALHQQFAFTIESVNLILQLCFRICLYACAFGYICICTPPCQMYVYARMCMQLMSAVV